MIRPEVNLYRANIKTIYIIDGFWSLSYCAGMQRLIEYIFRYPLSLVCMVSLTGNGEIKEHIPCMVGICRSVGTRLFASP
jgi:hypothetical protein